VVEWFLPRRADLPAASGFYAELRTQVGGVGGSIVVETRPVVETSSSGEQRWRWETTVCPADAPDVDGPEATSFARCDSHAEARVAHEQAVEFARNALATTVRERRTAS
jgi:hypothetical protein